MSQNNPSFFYSEGISKVEPRDSHAVCNLWMHPPASPCPNLFAEAEPPKNFVPSDVARSFMPDIAGYISEMVELLLKGDGDREREREIFLWLGGDLSQQLCD